MFLNSVMLQLEHCWAVLLRRVYNKQRPTPGYIKVLRLLLQEYPGQQGQLHRMYSLFHIISAAKNNLISIIMTSILKTVQLSHKYSSTWAIRDINLELNQAGVIGLLGSNGAGKSTTMNIICGVLNQTEGAVLINGVDLREDPELAKQNIGFLPQNPPLYTDLTVDEYLHYTAELRKMEKHTIREAVQEAKEKVGITHFSTRLIKNLSGGYRQRVGIAQAIIHKPKTGSDG